MKSQFLLINFFILFLTTVSISQDISDDRGLFVNFDVGKSIYHLTQEGYSFDIEGFYVFPQGFMLGLAYGNTKFFREQLNSRNIADYTIQGSYIKPSIGFSFFDDNNVDIMLNLGVVLSRFDEEFKPFIPGSYFPDFQGDVIKRDNVNVIGGEIQSGLWLFRQSKVSVIISARCVLTRHPPLSDNRVAELLNVRYMPGIGENIFNQGILKEEARRTNLLLFGANLKLVYKIF